jgi:hypothetical protein
MHNVAAIVNYCTNDFRFLDDCLLRLKKKFRQVIVPVCDHFFDGTPEDLPLLKYSFAKHPDVLFILFKWGEKLYGLSPVIYDENKKIHYWHSTARFVGYQYIKKGIEGALFLDVDEIIDLERFDIDFEGAAMRFDSYFYMRAAYNRAKIRTENALYVKIKGFNPDHLLVVAERMGTFDRIAGEKKLNVVGKDGDPVFHHYSWVRSEEELMKKVVSWGHYSEKNWEKLLKQELSMPIGKRDCLYDLEYECVTIYIDPLRISLEQEKEKAESCAHMKWKDFQNVIYVNREEVLKRYLYRR